MMARTCFILAYKPSFSIGKKTALEEKKETKEIMSR
jgi:hypothetical protein